MGATTLINVINLIYECGFEKNDWNTVVKNVCHMIGANSAGLFAINLKTHSFCLLGQHNFLVEHIPCHKGHNNIVPSEADHISAINVCSTEEYCIKLNVHKTNQQTLNQAELKRLQELNPHFERAFKVSNTFADIKKDVSTLNSALSKVPLGIVAVDKALKLYFVNNMAQTVIDNRTDVHLRSNYLVVDDIAENTELKQAIQKVLKNTLPFTSISLGQNNTENALTITVTAAEEHGNSTHNNPVESNIAILYLSLPQQNACISITALQDMYKLTPSEAQLALCLTNGATLQSYSSDKQLSIQTARTQLKSIFNKLHVKSQTELVRKLVTSSVNLIH